MLMINFTRYVVLHREQRKNTHTYRHGHITRAQILPTSFQNIFL